MLPSLAIPTAYLIWSRRFADEQLDNRVRPFLNERLPCSRGWLKAAREGLFLSSYEVAARLQVNRSTYSRLERAEERGTINLQTLERAAEAIDCEVVYAIRPKSLLNFSEENFKKVLPEATARAVRRRPHINMLGNAIAADARELTQSPKFRARIGWSKQK